MHFSLRDTRDRYVAWRQVMLKARRRGGAARADELAADDDPNGAATWRQIADAVGQPSNKTPPGSVH